MKFRENTHRDFDDRASLSIPWESDEAFAAFIRNKPIVAIVGESGTGKTLLCTLLMMRCMAVWRHPYSLEGNYFYGRAGKIPDEELTGPQFLAIDNLDRLQGPDAQKYRDVIADRNDEGRITILLMNTDEWLMQAPLLARTADVRQLRLL